MFKDRSGDTKINTITSGDKRNWGVLERGVVNVSEDLKFKCEKQCSSLLNQGDKWDACEVCVEEENKEVSNRIESTDCQELHT